ncbi:thiamine pyrophosphate-binding protein [Microvirga antarctica]|uniref:thiamine pyrophosphate-binding protein n=1 Tax=Microvirga antarctica TaxID=2819233 RepID=UPI001B30AAA7|nr:thiamine pyrophosphate-binding protein [Microvirga antarctica]
MSYTVGDLVAEFLTGCGVEVAFGIVSVHNIPILDAIGRHNRVRFVMARAEVGAGHMADGYGRASGELGVLISSTGPGAANCVPGLVEAQFAGTPLLHITGQTDSRFTDRNNGMVHDARDQLGMLKSVSKSAYRIRSPGEALGVLTRAAVDALSAPFGPVSVEIPIDIQKAQLARPATLDNFHLPVPLARQASSQELDDLAELVAKARRPMLWLGNGARDAGGIAEKFLDLGFGMVSSLAGRGIVPEDHPMNLGALSGHGIPIVNEFYQTVDLMLVVGSRLRGHETGDFNIKLPGNLVHIDVDPLANGRTYSNTFFVCADGASTLEQLHQRIASANVIDPEFKLEFAAMKGRAKRIFQGSLGPYREFASQLRKVMPRDALWVRDITISNTTWGNRLFEVLAPRSSIHPVSAGIGEGLSLGVGAAVGAKGRKTVIMSGDGGFFFNMSELWTAVQEGLDVTIIVMNDGGYGVIKHIQDTTAKGRRYYTDLLAPELSEVAKLAKVPFWRVDDADEFGNTVAMALAVVGPTIVEVDMRVIGTPPPYFPFAPAPIEDSAQ